MTTITKKIIPRHAEFISASRTVISVLRCGVKHLLCVTQG